MPWNPEEDKLWIRKINIVEKNIPGEPIPDQVEYDIKAVQDLFSMGFGRSVSSILSKNQWLVPSFMKTGFEMVKQFNADKRYEPINKAIHYQNFIEIMPVFDMEFAFNAGPGTFPSQIEAIQHVIDITKTKNRQREFPLSIAMEMRWMAYSDCLICPAHAVQKQAEDGKEDFLNFHYYLIGSPAIKHWANFLEMVKK